MTTYRHHAPVVRYHGTLTNWHGLWRVVETVGNRMRLRDPWGNSIRCRRTSVTIVDLPKFTDNRDNALCAIARRPGNVTNTRTRRRLHTHQLIEPCDNGWQATRLGHAAADALHHAYQ